MSETTIKIGFIGLGLMGGSIVKNLACKSRNLMVYDMDCSKRENFSGMCRVAQSDVEIFSFCDVLLL